MEKIKRLWSFLVYKLLYIQDPPEHRFNRQWRHWAGTYTNESFYAVSYELQITQFEGKPLAPRPVVIHQLGVQINPKKWQVSQDHTYYDGNHCSYNLGPISFYTSGSKNCKKCRGET